MGFKSYPRFKMTPEIQQNMSAAAKKRYADPEERKRASERVKKLHRDPNYKRRHKKAMQKLGKSRRGKALGAMGLSRSPEYQIWSAMIERCRNINGLWYHNYGGRGIRVCDEWIGRCGFARFYRCIGPRPTPQHTLDRIDNDGHYEPNNVRWATRLEQSHNSRRVRLVTIRGKTLSLSEWARRIGVTAPTLSYRIKADWNEVDLFRPGRK